MVQGVVPSSGTGAAQHSEHKVKTLTKENKDLKREIEEMKTVAIESAAMPIRSEAASGSDFWAATNGELLFFTLVDDDDDDEDVEIKIEGALGYMPEEWGTLRTFIDKRA